MTMEYNPVSERQLCRKRRSIRTQVMKTLHLAGIDYCLHGPATVSIYGVPLLVQNSGSHDIQIAVSDEQLEGASRLFEAAAKEDSACSQSFFFTLEIDGVHVGLLPASSVCRYPNGALSRAVCTCRNRRKTQIDFITRLPWLPDLLVSLLQQQHSNVHGDAFAGMLMDVYRLEKSWIEREVGALHKETAIWLVDAMEKQYHAFCKSRPVGWKLLKFFTSGRPLPGPLYRCHGHDIDIDTAMQSKDIDKLLLPSLVINDWPPPKREDWSWEDDAMNRSGNCCPGENNPPIPLLPRTTRGVDRLSQQENDDNIEENQGENEDDDEESDSDDDQDIVPQATLREVALACQDLLEENQIPFAVVGGFALNQYGSSRVTRDLDFVCQRFGPVKSILQADERFRFPPGLSSGAFQCFFHAENAEVEVNGLQAGVFGPRQINIHSEFRNGIWVLSTTELLRMKLKAYNSRQYLKDLDDIKFLLGNFTEEMDIERVDELFYDVWENFPDEVKESVEEWRRTIE